MTTQLIFHKTPHTPTSFLTKKLRSPSEMLLETHLTTFTLVFTGDEVCYISNKYQPPNNSAKYQYFYTSDFIYLLHFEKKDGVLHRKSFLKHPLFTVFSLILIVRFAIFQINTDFLINHLQIHFYTEHLKLLFHSNKKIVLSIVQVFRNIHFLPNAN